MGIAKRPGGPSCDNSLKPDSGDSLGWVFMAVAARVLREFPRRVTSGPFGCHKEIFWFTWEHSEKAREQERKAGAGSLVHSTDHPELQGEILAQRVSGRFIVINIFQPVLLSLQNLTFCNMEGSILGFTFKGLPSWVTYFFTWR